MVTIEDLPQQYGGKCSEEMTSENTNKVLWSVCLFVCFPIKETALRIVRYYRGNYTAKYINGNNLEDENK